MNNTVTRNAVDRLEMALLRKYKTPAAALAKLGFDAALISDILEEGKTMITRRRLARDEIEQPINAEQAIETIQQIFDGLEDDDAADLATMLERRLDETAQDSFRRGRRARDRRVPGAARDRRRPAMDTAGLPSFEELFPGVNRRKVW